MGTKQCGERTPHKTKTQTFLLELPLVIEAGQAARQRAHLEAGRQFYNAVLSAGTAPPAPDASRPRLESGLCYPPHTHARAQGSLLGPAGALRIFRVRFSRTGERAACLVAGRAPGRGAGPDARHSRLPRPQPGVCGQSPPRALQESGSWT